MIHHLVIYCVLSIRIRDFLVFEIRKNLDRFWSLPKSLLNRDSTVIHFLFLFPFLIPQIQVRGATFLFSPPLTSAMLWAGHRISSPTFFYKTKYAYCNNVQDARGTQVFVFNIKRKFLLAPALTIWTCNILLINSVYRFTPGLSGF